MVEDNLECGSKIILAFYVLFVCSYDQSLIFLVLSQTGECHQIN